MGILERAANLLERVQGRTTAMTQQAARRVRCAPEIAALDGRLATLRAQLEQSVSEVGKLAFRQWKNGDASQADAIKALCRAIDGMNGDYQQLLGELADLRASASVPTARVELSRSSCYIALGSAQPAASAAEQVDASLASARTGGILGTHGVGAELVTPGRTKRCPECFADVPGSQQYCPTCGIRME